jgi:Protein of unknown function (DUF5661)
MAIKAVRMGKKWVVRDEKGKVYGKHPTSIRANAQIKSLSKKSMDTEGKGEEKTDKKEDDEEEDGNKKGTVSIDPKQLAMGIKVEQEHRVTTGNNQDTIRSIAIDHLTEDKHYYDKLLKAGL